MSDAQFGVLSTCSREGSPRGALENVMVPSGGSVAGMYTSTPFWNGTVPKYGINALRRGAQKVARRLEAPIAVAQEERDAAIGKVRKSTRVRYGEVWHPIAIEVRHRHRLRTTTKPQRLSGR